MTKYAHKVREFLQTCWQGKVCTDFSQELLSDTFLFSSIVGKRVGSNQFNYDASDFYHAIPNMQTKLLKHETYKNLVLCNVEFSGAYLGNYRISPESRKGIVTISDFATKLQKHSPTGKSFQRLAEIIVKFERDKIAQMTVHQDLILVYQDLGLFAAAKNTASFQERQVLEESLNMPLTQREMEVLALILCGFSAKHTAERLTISHRTVETHLRTAYQKLDCTNKQQIIEQMYEKRILTLWWDLAKYVLEK